MVHTYIHTCKVTIPVCGDDDDDDDVGGRTSGLGPSGNDDDDDDVGRTRRFPTPSFIPWMMRPSSLMTEDGKPWRNSCMYVCR